MPDDGVARLPAATAARPPEAAPRSPALGIAAFVLAVLFALVPDVVTALVPDLTSHDLVGIAGIVSVASLLPFVLGLAAAVSRRGRYWGIAALTLALLSNYLVFALVNVAHVYLGGASL